MHDTLPPFWGPPLSTLPGPPPVPQMPSQEELDAVLVLLDKLAAADADRRMRKFASTHPPPRRKRS